tara:strand:- start:858 stop:1493 length:636 start_codon:yes stop_codon:yes gene_type:complete
MISNSLINKIFGTQERARHEVNSLKSTIECNGDVCAPIKIIPPSHYDEYMRILCKNFSSEDVRVQKQRQYNALCNILFDSRSDYLVHKSNYKEKHWKFLTIDDGTAKVDLSFVPDNLKDIQKYFFFRLRDLCMSETFAVSISLENMSVLDIVRFYLNIKGETHVIGYLMFESLECSLTEILVKTTNRFQRAAVQLIKGAFSKDTQSKVRLE